MTKKHATQLIKFAQKEIKEWETFIEILRSYLFSIDPKNKKIKKQRRSK